MAEVTLQPAEGDAIDTYIDQNNPTGNAGTSLELRLGFRSDADNYDSLFKFDLSSIAKGSKIQEAILTLTAYSSVGSGTGKVEIARILADNSDWTEGGCTWNTKDGSNSWAGSNGCETEGTDIAVSKLYTESVAYSWSFPGTNDFELEPSEFQALIDVGNYGFKMYSQARDGSVDRVIYSRSSNYGTSSDRPALYVRWIEPSGRLYEYTFNKYDPEKKLFNSMGQLVQPNEIRPNNWMYVPGVELPMAKVYDSLVTDPRMNYIVGVTNDEDRGVVGIEFDRNQFADQIIKRLVRGI